MPHTKSSKKDLAKSLKQKVKNNAMRSRLRTAVKKAKTSVAAAPADADTTKKVRDAMRELDRMATKGIIHKNQAARRKSRLSAMQKKAAQPAA